MNKIINKPRGSFQIGSSLLEVMISLFVMAIGLLGVLAMQTESIRHNQSSFAFSQAVYLANDIVERIRSNPGKDYSLAAGATPEAPETNACHPCDAETLRDHDIGEWVKNVKEKLPQGSATIIKMGADFYVINLFFNDTKGDASLKSGSAAADGRQTYTMIARI